MYEAVNIFLAMAQAMSNNGADKKMIAEQLAIALREVVTEGVGPNKLHSEIDRLLQRT